MDRIRLMPVDDNPAMVKAMIDFFSQKTDIEVICSAGDGVDALKKVDDLRPDILLLDAIMPRLDGFGVLEALRDKPGAPRAIMVTGLSRDDFVLRAMRLGASYYMVKPIDMEVLYARVLEAAGTERETAQSEPRARRHSAEEQVTNLFLTIGIPAHIKGYQYLREAVGMVLNDHDVINRITKELYPGIARRFATSPSKVERAMRHAIEVAWNRGRLDSVNRMYGYKVFSADDKPTNGEFIAMIADKVAVPKSA